MLADVLGCHTINGTEQALCICSFTWHSLSHLLPLTKMCVCCCEQLGYFWSVDFALHSKAMKAIFMVMWGIMASGMGLTFGGGGGGGADILGCTIFNQDQTTVCFLLHSHCTERLFFPFRLWWTRLPAVAVWRDRPPRSPLYRRSGHATPQGQDQM